MALYPYVVFLHVLGAIGLFAANALEAASLARLRRASTVAGLREELASWASIRWLGAPALVATLLPGLYLASVWHFEPAWIRLAVAAFLLLPALGGGITGVRLTGLSKAIPSVDGPLPAELAARAGDPLLVLSLRLRLAAVVGAVFLMEVKPPAALGAGVMVAALVAGAASAIPTARKAVAA